MAKGKEILDNTCQECHGLDTIVQQSQSAAQWRRTVQSMTRKGAVLTRQETDTLVDYLATYFGPETVDLNKAGAAELARILGLSPADAVIHPALPRRRSHSGELGRSGEDGPGACQKTAAKTRQHRLPVGEAALDRAEQR